MRISDWSSDVCSSDLLKIADQNAGYESNMAALVGDGTTTLNISGGRSGLDFGIEGALDSTLTTLNAAAVAANLNLNVSESDQDMTITLGSGNDTLNMGDSLSTGRSEEHTSELQALMRISYGAF